MYKIEYEKTNCHILMVLLIILSTIVISLFFCYKVYYSNFKKIFTDSSIKAHDIRIDYRITRHSGKYYTPVYFYEVDNKVYELKGKKNYYNNIELMELKDTIYYKKDNPEFAVSEYETMLLKSDIMALLILGVILSFELLFFIKEFNFYQKLKTLQKEGTLFKDIPYKIVDIGTHSNKNKNKTFMIEINIPGIGKKEFYGYSILDMKEFNKSKTIDLLIDLDDIDIRYMDFKIEKLY